MEKYMSVVSPMCSTISSIDVTLRLEIGTEIDMYEIAKALSQLNRGYVVEFMDGNIVQIETPSSIKLVNTLSEVVSEFKFKGCHAIFCITKTQICGLCEDRMNGVYVNIFKSIDRAHLLQLLRNEYPSAKFEM